jgi:hypothetical protein
LGTQAINNRLKVFRPFAEAREFARGLRLGGQVEWQRYCKGLLPDKPPKPDDVPSNANLVYAESGWAGWGDWLGTQRINNRLKVFRPFAEAREFARSLGLRNQGDWWGYCKGLRADKPAKPDDIPANAHSVYADCGWLGYGDWLGTGNIAPSLRSFRAFAAAREFVRSLRLSGERDWRRYRTGSPPFTTAVPDDIPSDPRRVYADSGWVSWGDFLGTDSKPRKRKRK